MSDSAVLLTVDALRYDCCSDGKETSQVSTPNIRSLLDEGELESFWSAGIGTQDSFRSILTGKGPFVSEGPKEDTYLPTALPDDVTTVAITSNPWLTRTYGWDRGWDVFVDFRSDSSSSTQDGKTPQGKTSGTGKLDRFEFKTDLRKRLKKFDTLQLSAHTFYRLYLYLTNSVPYPTGEEILNQLRAILDEVSPPILLWIHLMEPHTPWLPIDATVEYGPLSISIAHGRMETDQERLSEKQKHLLTDLYGHRVRSSDRFVGEIQNVLEKQSWYDDSLVFFTADHGEELQERGYFGHAHMGAPRISTQSSLTYQLGSVHQAKTSPQKLQPVTSILHPHSWIGSGASSKKARGLRS